jgi:TetR/AcrR family transcriptional regulator, transcriptional repressor for nem operon
VAKRARATIEALQALLGPDIAACQRNGDTDTAADADPGRLAALVLAVLRGIEALGKAGGETLTDVARTAPAVLPRPSH